MTTKIKVETHGWPVHVTTTDRYQNGDTSVLHTETRHVPRWSEAEFVLHSTRTIGFEELPGWEDKPADPAPAEAQQD